MHRDEIYTSYTQARGRLKKTDLNTARLFFFFFFRNESYVTAAHTLCRRRSLHKPRESTMRQQLCYIASLQWALQSCLERGRCRRLALARYCAHYIVPMTLARPREINCAVIFFFFCFSNIEMEFRVPCARQG